MSAQFQYIVLVLPTLFGLTLVGDGINKLLHEEKIGLINITVGIIFIAVVIFAYFFIWTSQV